MVSSRSSITRWLFAGLASLCGILSAACASRAAEDARQSQLRAAEIGTYRFAVRSADQLVIEGWFNVTADTVIVRATPGPCRYDADSSRYTWIRYQCNDRTVRFDRRRPATRAYVSWIAYRTVTRPICAQHEVNRQGVLVCVRRSQERVEEPVGMSLRIVPMRDPVARAAGTR